MWICAGSGSKLAGETGCHMGGLPPANNPPSAPLPGLKRTRTVLTKGHGHTYVHASRVTIPSQWDIVPQAPQSMIDGGLLCTATCCRFLSKKAPFHGSLLGPFLPFS